MTVDLETLEKETLSAIAAAEDLAALEAARLEALGKKGRLSELMKALGGMSPEDRKTFGPLYNGLKDRATAAIAARRQELEATVLAAKLEAGRVDVTLPVIPEPQGSIHPVSQVMDEIIEIFAGMGFEIAEGPDIEDDFHNFEALNFPQDHPAREMHDTFYLEPDETGERKLLRTHTSPVQIRSMMAQKPPLRIIIPGRTFRCDSDATHTPMFHQVEGLVIDKSTHMGHLKGCLEGFARAFFEVNEVKMRFRPSFFPFTEPSAEVDIGCAFRQGEIVFGEGDGWLEILGCGMVHPNVIKNVGLDPNEYQGFAFGCGIDRLAMLKYGIPDLRAFFHSDLRWLRHYGFAALDVPTLAARGVQ